ncbi:MAG: efflux RND transporter periplasmic adaptor subunit, partial [Candidatus Magnetoovum sp. WYHC-5]|nr:efflux RND transporter periplasmic adaptor subunit [Candidatus Magnetoovum sp. WYHC-5]
MHTINTKYAGWVEKLYIDYEGKYVKKGAVVAEIYSPKLLAAKEELLILYNMEKKKTGIYSGMFNKDREKLISGAKERLKNWDISEHEINQLIKDGAATRTVSVYSPHEGYVVEKMITAGSSISPGKPLFRIASLSKVWIIVDVYEQDVPYIKLGQSAEIYLANFPGKVFKSKVDYIYPELSGKTRTLKVRFPVDNPDGALKPGMYMEINTSFNIGEQLLVPTEAVIDDGVRKIVFTEEEEKGIFYPKEVALGLKTNGYYVVLGGLTEGEKVVQGANFLLDSDARLKGIKPLEKN